VRRTLVTFTVITLLAAATTAAGDLDLSPALTPGEFEELTLHLAEGILMPSGPSKPLGTAGFEIQLLATWTDADSGASWWDHSMSGLSDTFGGLGTASVMARVGLPWGVDVGGQIGLIADETFWSAELRKSLLEENGLKPSIGLSAAYSTLTSGPVDLDVWSLDLGVSKRFAILVPYGTIGYRWWEGDATWGPADAPVHGDTDRGSVHVAAGVHVTLPLLGFRFELRHGEVTAAYVGFGIGL